MTVDIYDMCPCLSTFFNNLIEFHGHERICRWNKIFCSVHPFKEIYKNEIIVTERESSWWHRRQVRGDSVELTSSIFVPPSSSIFFNDAPSVIFPTSRPAFFSSGPSCFCAWHTCLLNECPPALHLNGLLISSPSLVLLVLWNPSSTNLLKGSLLSPSVSNTRLVACQLLCPFNPLKVYTASGQFPSRRSAWDRYQH